MKIECARHVVTGRWTVKLCIQVGNSHVAIVSGSDDDKNVAASWCLSNARRMLGQAEQLLVDFGADEALVERSSNTDDVSTIAMTAGMLVGVGVGEE